MGETAVDDALGDRHYIEVYHFTHRPQDTVLAVGGGTGGTVGVFDGEYSSLYLEGNVRPATPSGLATEECVHLAAAGPHQLTPFPLHTLSGL